MVNKAKDNGNKSLRKLTSSLARRRAKQGLTVAVIVALIWLLAHVYTSSLADTLSPAPAVILRGSLYADTASVNARLYPKLARCVLVLPSLTVATADGYHRVEIIIGEDFPEALEYGVMAEEIIGSCSPYYPEPYDDRAVCYLRTRPIGSGLITGVGDFLCVVYHESLHALANSLLPAEEAVSSQVHREIYQAEFELIERLLERGVPINPKYLENVRLGYTQLEWSD